MGSPFCCSNTNSTAYRTAAGISQFSRNARRNLKRRELRKRRPSRVPQRISGAPTKEDFCSLGTLRKLRPRLLRKSELSHALSPISRCSKVRRPVAHKLPLPYAKHTEAESPRNPWTGSSFHSASRHICLRPGERKVFRPQFPVRKIRSCSC